MGSPAPSPHPDPGTRGLAGSLAGAVRVLEARLSGLADSVLRGDRLSGFPGRGLEAVGVREYQAGDEARGIDWRVTARRGKLHVREFQEERDLPTLILLHRSPHLRGGRGGIREVRVLEVAGLLSALALKEGDRVGLLQGRDGVGSYLSPARTRDRLPLLLRHLLLPPEGAEDTTLSALIRRSRELSRERSRIFLVGGFRISSGDLGPLRASLQELARRHALTPVRILDPAEGAFPHPWPLPLEDPASGRRWLPHPGRLRLRPPRRPPDLSLREALDREEEAVGKMLNAAGLREWRVDVEEPLVPALRMLLVRDRWGGGARV